MSIDSTRIRKEVHERYTRVAEQAAGCCPPADDCGCRGYDAVDLTQIPVEAVASGRGCGNPTALAELRPGEVVLDLGSGGGLDALLAWQRVGPGGHVYGVDATPAMIDLARRNAARLGADNVEFRPGDLENLPLPDGSIDVILSNCVINLTPDKRRVFAEAFRVLRPGGRLAISDIVIDPDLEGFPLPATAIRERLDWAACAAGALTTGDLHADLTAVGFESIALTIESRMSRDELPANRAELGPDMTPDRLHELAARFTSTAISARKPAA